jgi:hypothetical protein
MSILIKYFKNDGTDFGFCVTLTNGICGKQIFIDDIETNYIITENGTVYNIETEYKLKKFIISINNYYGVNIGLGRRGYYKTCTVHRLLGMGYIPNPNRKKVINHIDGNKLNNSLDNLEWCTYSENNKHAYIYGLKKPTKPRCGEMSNLCLHSEKEVRKVCKLFEKGYDPEGIYREFGISKAFTSKIYYRKSWKHISKDYNFDKAVLYNKFFDRDTTESIFYLYRAYMRTKDIMKYLNIQKNEINRSHLRLIIRRIKKYDKKVKKHYEDLDKPL